MTLQSLPAKTVISVARHKVPIAVTGLVVITGMAYSLFWAPVIRHDAVGKVHSLFKNKAVILHLIHSIPYPHWYWIAPGDIWGTFRAAQIIGWGYLGGIYSMHGTFLLPPGILLILLPVAKLAGLLHLTESFPFPLMRPTAWLVIGPYEMAISGVALFGLDALAERLHTPVRRRTMLCLAEGVMLWQVVALWGHPEDVLALGLGAYAIRAALDRRPVATGWLLGVALAMQPFVILIVPVVLAIGIASTVRVGNTVDVDSASTASTAEDGADTSTSNTTSGTPWTHIKQMLSILWRAAAVPVVLVATPLIFNPRFTWQALAVQPTYPKTDHPTPWLALAPKLGHGAVSGGPTRLFAIATACILGYLLWWLIQIGKNVEELIVPFCAISLASWCAFEAVMTPYYIWPALALALLAAGQISIKRLAMTGAIGMFATVFAFHHAGPWLYWGVVTASLAVACVIGMPRLRSTHRLGT
ncbi:MAG: hypothetical protein ACYDGY_05025 [Acidimicrobiales bacterium]